MYQLNDDDYLGLWKYFQDRADNVKGAMFQTVTWSLGFAGAILSFIIAQLDPADLDAQAPKTMIGLAVVGVILCTYSYILLRESRKHIRRNWDRADYCKLRLGGLDAVLEFEPKKRPADSSLVFVWNQVFWVIVAFALLFFAIILWLLVEHGA